MAACEYFIESTGELSKLHQEILELFNGDEEIAEQEYLTIFSDEFKEWYGDWENPEFDRNYLNEQGQPKLHEGGMMYSSLDGTHYSITGEKFQNFTPQEIEEITSQLAFQAVTRNKLVDFENGVSDKTTSIVKTIDEYVLEEATKAKEAFENGDEEAQETWDKLVEIRNNIVDFREAVIDFLEDKGIKTKIVKQEEIEEELDERGQDLNILESIRKNSKDNATANIKLLLSFIPKISHIEGNEYIYEKGDYLNSNKFTSFDEIWNLLQENLSDIVTQSTETSEVTDMFDSMMEKVADLAVDRPSIEYLLNKLIELPEWQKTQFVQAFSMSKYNFITTLVSGKSGNRTFKIGDAQNFSPQDIISDLWTNQFEESPAIDRLDSKFNRDYIKKNDVSELMKEVQSKKLKNISSTGPAVQSLKKSLSKIGITPSDRAFKNYLNADSDGIVELSKFKEILKNVDEGFKRLANSKDEDIFDSEGNMLPILRNTLSNVIGPLSKEQSKFEPKLSESTVLGKNGNQFWEYSKPSMMHSLINQIKSGDYSLLDELLGQPYAKGSRWLNHLDRLRREGDLKAIENIKIATFLQFKEEFKNDQGEDAQGIGITDIFADTFNKTLNFKRGSGHLSVNNLMTAADKSTHHQLVGLPPIEANATGTIGDIKIYNKEVVDTFKDYLTDELRRYAIAFDELSSLPKDKLVLYYHTDKDGNIYDKNNNLAGNAFKIHTFNNILSSVDGILDDAGKPITDDNNEPLLPDEVDNYISNILKEKIKSTYDSAIRYQLINEDGTNNAIDTTILANYRTSNPVMSAIADYTINALISNIEGTKMFNGDPGFYKSPADFLKRIPASYIDGLTLRLKGKQKEFTVAVLDNVNIPSLYTSQIEKAFRDAGYKEKDIEDLIKPYAKVNLTDAQGWITPDRYKFLMKSLGKTNPEWDAIFKKATTKKNGKWQTLTADEFKKLAAQPLKGVYFGQKNGMPTYLKYSQAVLWPSMIEGSTLEQLRDKMKGIDEAVVVDGIKVGLVQPTKIHNQLGEIDMSEISELNTITLDNRNWRLQQDLPNKGLKKTLLGSQIQKNILANIDPESMYGDISGQELINQINSVVSELSNRGAQEVLRNFKVDEEGNIDKSILDNVIIEELKAKGGSENIIKAIERGIQYDALFQHRDKIQNILFSHVKKRTVDITTNGGSFIQMSAFGINRTIADQVGVKWLVENPDLKPPLKNEDGTVTRGQVLIPHTLLAKAIPNYRELSIDELKSKIDPEVLRIIGYRIPNQGMSSNDALDVVGILPPEMGDTIVAYNEITTKTGSDFDIDKMYIMVPHFTGKGEARIVKYNEEDGPEGNSKKALQNQLISLYDKILTDPKTYDSLIASIDATFMEDDIKALYSEESTSDLNLFDPVKQLELKVDLMAGKAGVGQTANQLADHPLTQIANVTLNQYLGVGVPDKKGNTTFANIMDENGDKAITTVVSAFLNAYVDIAKDPYIIKGNHNTFTANTVFMLLRAGVDFKWVNAFIGQPILKELVEETNKAEGRMSIPTLGERGGIKKPIDIVKERYLQNLSEEEQKNLPNYYKLVPEIKNKFTLGKLREMIKSPNPSDSISQLEILTIFSEWQEISKSVRDSVLASKADVNAAGHDVIEKQGIENRKNKVLNSGTIINFSDKFTKDGKKTSLGTFYDNSVGLVNLISEKLFITDSKGFRRLLNEMSTELGKGLLTDRDLGKSLEKEIFAYLYSQTNLYTPSEEIIPMFRSKYTIASRTERLKNHKRYKENPLIKALKVEKGHKKIGYSYVTISNTKNQPKYFKDQLYRGWLELLEDPETKKFANDLVRYSYYSSGFKRSIGSIFEHVPNEWVFGNLVNEQMKEWKFKLEEDGIFESIKDQVYRHKWKDATIVPKINSKIKGRKLPKSISSNNAGLPTNMLFTMPDFIGDYKKDNQWPRFVTKEQGSQQILYKLAGTVNTINDGNKVEHAVYHQTYKLGYSSKGKTIVEYGTQNKESIFSDNNIPSELLAGFKKSLNFVYDNVTPPSNALEDVNVTEPFVIDYQKFLREAEETNKKCK